MFDDLAGHHGQGGRYGRLMEAAEEIVFILDKLDLIGVERRRGKQATLPATQSSTNSPPARNPSAKASSK